VHTTNLRKVGGSVMLAVPPAILDMLKLQAGATVGLAVDDGRLVVDPRVRPSYTMEELLALCEAGADDQTDCEWLNVVPLGREL
jgi:antitoxin ChpS